MEKIILKIQDFDEQSLSFHRPGSYGINLGLDTDNVLKIGGWSSAGI